MDPEAARELLDYLRSCYPAILLLLFVVAFVANTMVIARNANQEDAENVGPGGRALPRRARSSPPKKTQTFSRTVKHCFNWLSVGVLLTFLADASIYIAHVVIARSEQWWRGQSVVVSWEVAPLGGFMRAKFAGVFKDTKANQPYRRSTSLALFSTTP